MFDCGHFRGVADRELLAVEAVCISHTHMDHFIGLDHVLRAILHREAPLSIYGPEGIIDRTLSKLHAYTWNLTAGYGLEILIQEVGPEAVRTVRARADKGFAILDEEVAPRSGATIAESPQYSLDAALVDHRGIPCLAYVMKEPFHINIRKDRLKEMGFCPGEWISRLKESIHAGRLGEMIPVKTREGHAEIPACRLEQDLVIATRGQTIAYVTDIACTSENLKSLEGLAADVDILFIEAFYLDEMKALAGEKGHLTAGQAGMIAGRFGARRTIPMHISPRYHERAGEIYAEMGLLDGRGTAGGL